MPIEYHVNESGIGLLRVNRPHARNALDWAAQEAFATAVSEASQNESLRALIITGTGDKAFVSGADLKELAGHPDEAAGARLNRVMSKALSDLIDLPVPVIAAVNGDAIGGGCEILTACDLRLAAASARFAFRQVYNGLTTGWGGTGRLVELLGQSRAMEFLLTGRMFTAAEAQDLGLIHRLAPDNEDVVQVAMIWAGELTTLPRRALAATKALVHAASHLSLDETNQLETHLFVNLWPSADHLEAMNAFTEKRPPRFNQD
ncbi:MAG: enoyl-CoA hydratase/isomerase family protein [Chloroflexota bacterium]